MLGKSFPFVLIGIAAAWLKSLMGIPPEYFIYVHSYQKISYSLMLTHNLCLLSSFRISATCQI